MCMEERGGVFVSYIALTLILVDYGKGLKIRDGTIDFFLDQVRSILQLLHLFFVRWKNGDVDFVFRFAQTRNIFVEK